MSHWLRPLRLLLLAALAASCPLAWGHVDQAATGFMSGLLHPVFGPDHFLAMLSVGVVSAQLGGRSIWTIPATFVCAMIVGGAVGVMQIPVPMAEAGIAASVVVLGLAIVVARESQRNLPIMVITAFFGFLHGHAHGLEMPKAADPVYYAAGFVTGTASIHILGVLIGHALTRRQSLMTILRHMGSAMAGAGMFMLVRGVS